ncbi:MAG: hypothetical protein HOO93_05030 [Methyloglobulus sp.]|nr:hypothetical protein [Methyloglobulus sp.]
MKNRIFHTAAVGCDVFSGLMKDDGAYFFSKRSGDAVPYGESRIVWFSGDRWEHCRPRPRSVPGFWATKYASEARIDLHDFSRFSIDRLSSEFGLWVVEGVEFPSYSDMQACFYASPAFAGLRAWVKAHPRLAVDCGDTYCSGWKAQLLLAD